MITREGGEKRKPSAVRPWAPDSSADQSRTSENRPTPPTQNCHDHFHESSVGCMDEFEIEQYERRKHGLNAQDISDGACSSSRKRRDTDSLAYVVEHFTAEGRDEYSTRTTNQMVKAACEAAVGVPVPPVAPVPDAASFQLIGGDAHASPSKERILRQKCKHTA